MIEFQNISLSYENKEVIRDLSFSIKPGESVCLRGSSGCGKSSVLHALLGFITPNCGKIFVEQRRLDSNSIQHIREQVAYLPQDLSFPFTTVKELIDAPFKFKANRLKKHSTEVIFSTFAELGLEANIYSKNLNEISIGQKQRVMLALMKLLDKEILLLDEPTSALDPDSVVLVINFLKSLSGKTILAVSHDELFAQHFDKVIHIKQINSI
ncbi:MAG: ATP-binding cassette domain-containing protein [Bacteroidales bacterium]|nr:ATP-binding cassette domain-containing protein [Bacteroidales bacterium]